MKRTASTLRLILLCLFLSSCASPELRYIRKTKSYKPSHSFSEDIKTVYSSENEIAFTDCDYSWRSSILDTAIGLEALSKKIISVENIKPAESDSKIGGYELVDYPYNPAEIDQWTDTKFSWRDPVTGYQKYKMTSSLDSWNDLDTDMFSLLAEDLARLRNGKHPSLRRQDKSRVITAADELNQCIQSPECVIPVLSEESDHWLRESPLHAALLDRISSDNAGFSEKRELLQFLAKQTGIYKERYFFHQNTSIQIKDNTLIVPLDLSVFGDDHLIVTRLLENAWSAYGLAITIIQSTTGYRVEVPKSVLYDNVDHKKKLLQLTTPIVAKVFIHEFGHVLGLPDNYYHSFDQRTCSGYLRETYVRDIMSSARTGQVLPEHIQQIKEVYNLK